MDDLDFSGLTDDQLVGLLRAALQEAVRRHPGVAAAVQAAVLDEAEKADIYMKATAREAAAMRARERQRVATEAAAKVRTEAAVSNAEAQTIRDREAAAKARLQAEAEVKASLARDARYRDWISRASALVGLPPESISITVYRAGSSIYRPKEETSSVFLNEGSDRYERDHLVAYRGTELKTKGNLISKKPGLLDLCAELRATYNDVFINGADLFETSGVKA